MSQQQDFPHYANPKAESKSDKKYRLSLVWLRRDLRLSDHRVIEAALEKSERVLLAFVFDINILSKIQNKSDSRISFIFDSLQELNSKLKKDQTEVTILYGDPLEVIPKLVSEVNAEAVFVGRDYEPYAKNRDAKIESRLKKEGFSFYSIKDHVIFEGSEILNGSGEPYRVFTPYKNAWLKAIRSHHIRESVIRSKAWAPKPKLKTLKPITSISEIGFEYSKPPIAAGETEASKILDSFKSKIANYHKERDFPELEGTSHLSPHFRFGTISIRSAVRLCRESRTAGSRVWLSELIWREFYQMILDQYPFVTETAFRPDFRSIKWPGKKRHFENWKQGQTGYPLVDAAMRNFAKTGLIHNRLRMIVASFLVKDLLIDWRLGEAYFAERLLDFDLAANNGGWQWCASTGCDSQPYFRIFNPIAQSEKFDPTGSFIRTHLPELRGYSDKWIHEPNRASLEIQKAADCIIGEKYPSPIVEHSIQREKALELFKNIKA